jgi:cytokinin dehydrogenase
VEFSAGREPTVATHLRDLGCREIVHAEGTDTAEYAARYDARFEMMRATGAWQQAHPWLECLLPWDRAADILPSLIDRLPLSLGDGHRIMPLAHRPRPALLMVPDGQPAAIAVAILPTGVAPSVQGPVLEALREAHDQLVAAGGKRYLSGWLFEPDDEAWRRHYGEHYDAWRARKRQLDPSGILRSRLRHPHDRRALGSGPSGDPAGGAR